MLAATPISRPTRSAIKTPSIPGTPNVAPVDGIVVGTIGLTILALVAPAIAMTVLIAAGLLGVIVLVSRIAPTTPAIEDAHRVVMTLSTQTNYSFSR